jgi:hypothetical protein
MVQLALRVARRMTFGALCDFLHEIFAALNVCCTCGRGSGFVNYHSGGDECSCEALTSRNLRCG